MNVNSKRNLSKEARHYVFRWYDIHAMNNGGLSEDTYIGSVILASAQDEGWRLNDPDAEQFGDFAQCVAELKIQAELARD